MMYLSAWKQGSAVHLFPLSNWSVFAGRFDERSEGKSQWVRDLPFRLKRLGAKVAGRRWPPTTETAANA
jgi:hypothetical protein